MGYTAWRCLIDDCHYTYLEPAAVLASTFGQGEMAQAVVAQQMQRLESAVRAHYDTHTAGDYLRTITRLQQLCRDNGIVP
jgi:hypothetical protein